MLKIRYQSVLTIVLAASAAIVLSNCSGSSNTPATNTVPNPNAAAGTFGAVYNMIYRNNCAECHSPSGSATVNYNVQLDFTSQANAYSTLVADGVHGATSTGTCSAVKIIDTTTPANSYVLAEVVPGRSHSDFGVTGCTPYAGHGSTVALSSSEQTDLINWIQNGAQNN